MYSKEVQVTNQVGLYARPATFFIQKANEFKSTILVEKEERRVNAKSLLGMFLLSLNEPLQLVVEDDVDTTALFKELGDYLEIED